MAIDIRMNLSQYDSLGRPFGAEGVLKVMDKYSIERAALVSGLAVDSDLRLGNKELFDVIKSNDRLFGYLSLNPNFPEASIQLMRTAMVSRKFVAAALYYGSSMPYPNLEDYKEILNAYRRFGKPVFVQIPNAEAITAAEQMAQAFPNIKFIFGSMGGDDWKRAMSSQRLLNVMLETSGSLEVEKIEEAVEIFGGHRILFGSDMPFSDPASMLALIQSSNIPKDEMAKILGENAKKLFNLDRAVDIEEEPEAE